jgi:hypothetical protein
MVHNRTTNFRNLAAQLFLGSIALASVILAFFRLGVDLASNNVGPGAEFQFTLPLHQEDTL